MFFYHKVLLSTYEALKMQLISENKFWLREIFFKNNIFETVLNKILYYRWGDEMSSSKLTSNNATNASFNFIIIYLINLF